MKIFIVLFCLWHMGAALVQAFSLVRFPAPVMAKIGSYTTYVQPYMSLISSHQDWNLFAPDPLLRITEMSFEKLTATGSWVMVRRLDGDHLSFFRRAPELKIMGNMLDRSQDHMKEAYIQDLCRTEELPNGTPIGLRRRYADIPGFMEALSLEVWRQWKPVWTEWFDYFTSCKQTS